MLKKLILKLAHTYVWEKIIEDVLEEISGNECPNYDSCCDNFIENYEPCGDEGRL